MLSIAGFDLLVEEANKALLDRAPATIAYNGSNNLAANAQQNEAAIKQEIGEGANIYAIWAREKPSARWVVMYIGQRSWKSVRERIKQHLFKTPKGTQSKIEQVRALVKKHYAIGITTVLVSPDPMRLSVEDQIIHRNTKLKTGLLWNDKSRYVAPRHR